MSTCIDAFVHQQQFLSISTFVRVALGKHTDTDYVCSYLEISLVCQAWLRKLAEGFRLSFNSEIVEQQDCSAVRYLSVLESTPRAEAFSFEAGILGSESIYINAHTADVTLGC